MAEVTVTTDVRPSMALELKPQKAQAHDASLTPANLYALLQAGQAWAVRVDGVLKAIGGHSPAWAGRTIVWGYLADGLGAKTLLAMSREVQRQLVLLEIEFPRIEAYAERHHEAGRKWLQLLGFRHEGLMRKFCNGRDYHLYARISDGVHSPGVHRDR